MRVKFNQAVHLADHKGQKGSDYARGTHEVPDHHIATPYFLALAKDGLVEDGESVVEGHKSLADRQKALYDKIAHTQSAVAKTRHHDGKPEKPEPVETQEGSQIPGTTSGLRAAEIGGRGGEIAPASPTSPEAQSQAKEITEGEIKSQELKDANEYAGTEEEERRTGKKRRHAS
jgi:hypothetical protein